MKNTIRSAAAVALCAVLLAGCGSSQTVMVSGTSTISKGQELTDLQRALTDGAITQAEYDRLRSKILARPN